MYEYKAEDRLQSESETEAGKQQRKPIGMQQPSDAGLIAQAMIARQAATSVS